MHRKGLSPLVATLLLIGFSVALGAIVMNWGKTYIEARAEFVKDVDESTSGCVAIELKLIEVAGKPHVCVDSKTTKINLFVENTRNVKIDNIDMRVVGTSDISESTILNNALSPLDTQKIEASHKPVGRVQQIQLIPMIGENGNLAKCVNQRLVLDEPFNSCS